MTLGFALTSLRVTQGRRAFRHANTVTVAVHLAIGQDGGGPHSCSTPLWVRLRRWLPMHLAQSSIHRRVTLDSTPALPFA